MFKVVMKLAGVDFEFSKSFDWDFNDKPRLYLSTHASYLDVFGLYTFIKNPLSFPAKAKLYKVPMVGDCVRWSSCIPIYRNDLSKSKE